MEEIQLKLGQKVSFRTKLKRKRTHVDSSWRSQRRDWVDVDSKEKEGVLVGIRNLQNGVADYEDEIGYVFYPESRFKAYMVVSSLGRKPFFVREVTLQS